MGVTFAAPPGIVTAETFRRGVARGFPAALSVQLGSLIGDATYCLLALAGVAVLIQNPMTQRALGIISVLFLVYLTISGLRAELAPAPISAPTKALVKARSSAFLTGMLLSLTNPWAIGFWLSLGGTLAAYGAMESSGTMVLFFASFFGACLVYAFVMSILIGVTHRAIPPKLGKWISIACSLAIGVLAIGVAIQVIQMFVAS